MTSREKAQITKELAQQLCLLKEQKNILESEVSDCVGKRREFNVQVKTMRIEIHDLRDKRDKLNERVRNLKLERNAIITEIRLKIEERKKVGHEIQTLLSRKPSRSRQSLQKEFEAVEWKIQTSSLTLQEEKELVGKAQHLETQLLIYRRIEQAKQRADELRNEIEILKSESELRHNKLTETALRSQETHDQMLSKIKDANEIKLKADEIHNRFLKAKEKKTRLQESIAEITSQVRQLENEIRKKELETKKQGEQELRETLEKRARDKLKHGKKLSWNEFQLLAENKEETQN